MEYLASLYLFSVADLHSALFGSFWSSAELQTQVSSVETRLGSDFESTAD